MLLDCGSRTALRLLEKNLTLADIDYVIITHPHPDHIGDLVPSILSMYLTANRFPEKKRPTLLPLHGYPGFKKDFQTLCDIMFPDWLAADVVSLAEHGNDDFAIGKLKISTRLVPHMEQYMQTFAIRFDDGNKSLTYSADTGKFPGLAKLAKDTDVALFEASFSTQAFKKYGSRYGHMTPQEAAQTAAEAHAKKLILTHFYEGLEPEENILKSARQYFDGPVVLANDGLEVEI